MMVGVWREGAASTQMYHYIVVVVAIVGILMLSVLFLGLAIWVMKAIVEGAAEIRGHGRKEGKGGESGDGSDEERIELRGEGE